MEDYIDKETNDMSDLEETKDLTVKFHGGISSNRIVNIDKCQIIDDLIKCPICLNYLNNPYECEICGGLYCEDCLQDWLKAKKKCPMKCQELKIKRADINCRKLLNILELRCQNYPECKFTAKYWDLLVHEEKCNFQKIKCPNYICKYKGSFPDISKHLQTCQFGNIQCGFCKAVIPYTYLNEHLDSHQKDKTFLIKSCSLCGSDQDIRRCICHECICENCLEENEFSTHKECNSFSTGENFTTKLYNVSSKPLPINFECKISFLSVAWIRVGITFEPKIADLDEDVNCPPYDIYCILEDLKQFYTYKSKWKFIFNTKNIQLSKSTEMIMRFKNGELRYFINGECLDRAVKIPLINKGPFYLFIQCRSDKSKAKIDYITEIFD